MAFTRLLRGSTMKQRGSTVELVAPEIGGTSNQEHAITAEPAVGGKKATTPMLSRHLRASTMGQRVSTTNLVTQEIGIPTSQKHAESSKSGAKTVTTLTYPRQLRSSTMKQRASAAELVALESVVTAVMDMPVLTLPRKLRHLRASTMIQRRQGTEIIAQEIGVQGALKSGVDKSLNTAIFTCFPKLPQELQRMVWEAALPGPRVVEVLMDYECVGVLDNNGDRLPVPPRDDPGYEDYRDNLDRTQLNRRIVTNEPPPVMLSICKVSRIIALGKYTLTLDTPDHPSFIRIDPLTDTVSVAAIGTWDPDHGEPVEAGRHQDGIFDGSGFVQNVLDKLRFLAIDCRINEALDYYLDTRLYKALEKLTIIQHPSDYMDWDLACADWPLKAADIQFIPPSSQKEIKETSREVAEVTKELNKRHGKHKLPEIEFVHATRDGKPCCWKCVDGEKVADDNL